jgi:hypothetical protein
MGTAREQRLKADGRTRASNPINLYKAALPSITPGEFDFSVSLIRPEKKGPAKILKINRGLVSLNWSDEGSELAGDLTFKRADPLDPSDAPIHRGHRVRLNVAWRGRQYQLWTMIVDGEPDITLSSGEIQVTLNDDLWPLRRTSRDWKFRKTKRRPKGWPSRAAARYVAKKSRVRIGHLPPSKGFLPKIEMEDASPLEVLQKIYEEQGKINGLKYTIKLRNGKLVIRPLRRGKVLYTIRGQAKEATPVNKPRKEEPNTVIEAKGRVKKKKVEVRVFRRKVCRRFGWSVKEVDYGRVKSKAELRRRARRDLALELKVDRTATLTIAGVPFLEKGDTIFWKSREPGWAGKTKSGHPRGLCFATAVRHSLTPEDFSTELDVSQVDPYLADRKRRDKEQRDRQREARKRRQSE